MEPKFPYRQIADDLREKINSGELRGQLPTVAQLAERYGVVEMTVSRALRILKDDGLIVTVRGLGIFVAEATTE